jgi:hypothetical protein
MKLALVAVQILIAVVLVAALMPLVLIGVPAAQDPRLGPALAVGGLVLGFVLIRLVWPARK